MCLGIYYMTAKNNAVKLFTGVTTQSLYVLDMLCQENRPVPYKRLFDLLHDAGYTVNERVLIDILKRSIDAGLVTRSPVAGNVLYCITMEGKKLLQAFNKELDRIVAERVRKYGNGFDLE